VVASPGAERAKCQVRAQLAEGEIASASWLGWRGAGGWVVGAVTRRRGRGP
jgi:hypothetical protein